METTGEDTGRVHAPTTGDGSPATRAATESADEPVRPWWVVNTRNLWSIVMLTVVWTALFIYRVVETLSGAALGGALHGPMHVVLLGLSGLLAATYVVSAVWWLRLRSLLKQGRVPGRRAARTPRT